MLRMGWQPSTAGQTCPCLGPVLPSIGFEAPAGGRPPGGCATMQKITFNSFRSSLGLCTFLLENLEQFTASVLFFSICNIIFHATQFQKKKWPKRAERGQKRPKGWKWAIVGKNESQPFARSQSALHSNCILANNKRNTEAEHCFCLCPKILSLCPKSYVGLALINNKKIKLPASLELLGDSLPQMCPFMRIEPNWTEFWIAVPLTYVTDLRWVLPFCFCFHQIFFLFHFISFQLLSKTVWMEPSVSFFKC